MLDRTISFFFGNTIIKKNYCKFKSCEKRFIVCLKKINLLFFQVFKLYRGIAINNMQMIDIIKLRKNFYSL